MMTVADYMELMANADLKEAQKKVPNLRWGTSLILDDGKACVQGVTALAACATPEELDYETWLPQDVLERFGWMDAAFGDVNTCCPEDGCGANEDLGQEAVAHVNDLHPRRSVPRILRAWAKAEREKEE